MPLLPHTHLQSMMWLYWNLLELQRNWQQRIDMRLSCISRKNWIPSKSCSVSRYNALGSFFSTYPTAKFFPRSASNHVSDTKSRLVGRISGLALVLNHKKGGIIILELDFDFSMDIILSCAIYLS